MLLEVDVVRHLSATPELRDAATSGSLGVMNGCFSTFNDWYRVESVWEGEFMERLAPGAFADTIAADRPDMRVLFDHGFDSIGNKVLGPIDVLEERSAGPYYEVPLFDTSYNRDLLPGLRAGVYGASFRMRVQGEEWDDEPKASRTNPKGIPERTITRAKVMEFGPVTFPANPKASASMRSTTDLYYDRLRQRDHTVFEAAVRAAGRNLPDQTVRALLGDTSPEHIEDFTGQPSARSAGGGEHGAEPANDEAHPSLSARTRERVLRMKGIK
jgi:HK97 family phage prohead protease